MSIEDYALELGVDTKTVISKLKELGFKYNNDDDILDDEAIIMLDNELTGEKENNLTEEMKNTNQLYWVGMMNNFKNEAEEIVFNELIYV